MTKIRPLELYGKIKVHEVTGFTIHVTAVTAVRSKWGCTSAKTP